jgi:hypothetical protein
MIIERSAFLSLLAWPWAKWSRFPPNRLIISLMCFVYERAQAFISSTDEMVNFALSCDLRANVRRILKS